MTDHNLPQMRNSPASLPQQQKAQRAEIGLRAQAILNGFWRDDDVSDALRIIEIEGWMDVLESCSQDEIRRAWAEYQRTGPRTAAGRLIKPDAGALWRIIIKTRPRPVLVREESCDIERERMDPETANAIVAAAGFPALKRFGEP